MPKGTRVSNCVEKVKRRGGNVNPYAVCQASTGQSYATGKPLFHASEKATRRRNAKHMDK